jgi:hypothetical protein
MGSKMSEPKDTDRKQINVRLERELYDFLVKHSKENYKTVTAIIREMIADLYKQNRSTEKPDCR